MKKQLKALLLVVLLANYCLPALSQSSTQGKEFWVSLIPSKSPDGENPSSNGFVSYIAISAPKACSVRVSNPNASPVWSQTYTIQNDNSWLEIKDIPLDQWYSNSMPASERVLNKGIKVEATEEVSVYTCLRWNYSMDATNILPVTALQSEYIVQTYGPSNKDGIKRNVFSVLAAEDCIVDITLTAQTEGGKTNTIPNLSLKAGQVYHVRSAENESLNGSRIVARNGKKIAVFAGCPLGNIPNVFADRDLVYEQLFPVDYWGKNFIVVRSKEKDANRVIITAQNDNTDVTIYGHYDPSNDKTNAPHTTLQNYSLTLQAGESYEFEMSIGYAADPRDSEPAKRWDDKRKESLNGVTFVDSTVYISASCPCAVLCYDVGNSYLRKDAGKETVSFNKPGKDKPQNYGAPAMTWIAPIEQMMNDVVFGVMGTDKTDRHFVNIIVPQAGVNTATMNGRSLSSYFHPVESNPSYYYARITLPKTVSGTQNPFYRLHCEEGFTATVYGNGDDESYAYTVGSSTIKRAIKINENNVYEEDTRDTKHKYCIGNVLTFNAQVGTDEITRTDWYFGDGTTEYQGLPQTTHQYTSPGWYDVTADLYGKHACTNEPSIFLGSVHFSFRVVRPDTVIGEVKMDTCISLESYKEKPAYWDDTVQENCYDDVVLNMITYRRETEETKDTLRGWDEVIGYNGRSYYVSTDVVDEDINSYGCTHYIRYYVDVIQCLDMSFSSNALSICPGENVLVAYTKSKGDIKDEQGRFVVPGVIDTIISIPNYNTQIGELTLPTKDLKTPGYYTGTLTVEDKNCDTKQYQINLVVNYPSDIFQFKFNNVLAVYQNKGYQFTTYQWYVNGMPVDGATSSILYLGQNVTFKEGDMVFVMLTDKNGMTLPSCPQILSDIDPDMDNDALNQVPARKMLINSQFVIRKGDTDYDIYGQKVK